MRSRYSFRKSAFVLAMICLAALSFVQSPARERAPQPKSDGERGPLRTVVLDGSGVHDVGQLIMHTGNWGAFGSYPGSGTPISQYPSAEWPAGSGVEYLNIAGLWVGGLREPYPPTADEVYTSTAAFEMEFRPTVDPIDRIYETFEGVPAGNRLPWPAADDDGDGMIDEDFLDGRDNDGDGMIDEDFAAISQQMFSSWYTDDQPEAAGQYPRHRPLNLKVRQESYQWIDPRFDDFVGVSFTIQNAGTEDLEGVYLGMLLDFDIGLTDLDYLHDTNRYWEGNRTTELGPASIRMAYLCHTKNDEPISYFGAMLLGHTVSPDGVEAPVSVGVNSFKFICSDCAYANGGDPTDDGERYELMRMREKDKGDIMPRDYRALMSAGPFRLTTEKPLEFHVGFLCGATFDEFLDNAARCQKLYDGLWFDIDRDPATGVDGRETQVHWIVERPAVRAAIDIRPHLCPNPFNVNIFDFLGRRNPLMFGVLPVAILGSEWFDVRGIDVETVRLEGVEPLDKWHWYRDVSSPVQGGEPCECGETGPDGYKDLIMNFSKRQIAAALLNDGLPQAGQQTALALTGNLRDGTRFEAADCVLFVGPPPDADHGRRAMLTVRETRLLGASPNPFNPVTTIRYELVSAGRVNIAVYDLGGRMVRTLVDQVMEEGRHDVVWDGRNTGGSIVASGIYFCRLTTPGFTETRKMVLLK